MNTSHPPHVCNLTLFHPHLRVPLTNSCWSAASPHLHLATQDVASGHLTVPSPNRCGSVTNMAPYQQRLEEGVEPTKAWEQSRDEIDEKVKYGTWNKDYFLSKPDDSGRFCHKAEIKSV